MRTTSVQCCLAVSLVVLVSSTANAQSRILGKSSNVWDGVSIGAALGRSGNEDDNHRPDDRGLDVRGNVDVPLGSRLAARIEVGRVSWEFDQYGPLHRHRNDIVTVNRVTVGLLAVTHPANPVRGYIGGGVGLYRWGARAGTIDEAVQRGGTFTMGLGIPVRDREWAITGDMQMNVMRSPNGHVGRGPESPVAGNEVLSLTFSIGMRKHF